MSNEYTILVRNQEGKRALGRPRLGNYCFIVEFI
jgi:hypothetical protein